MQARLPFQLGFGPAAGGDPLSHGEVVPNELLSRPVTNQHHGAGDTALNLLQPLGLGSNRFGIL